MVYRRVIDSTLLSAAVAGAPGAGCPPGGGPPPPLGGRGRRPGSGLSAGRAPPARCRLSGMSTSIPPPATPNGSTRIRGNRRSGEAGQVPPEVLGPAGRRPGGQDAGVIVRIG